MDWKKGDIAICIDDGDLGKFTAVESDFHQKNNILIRLNAEYIVNNVYTCPICNGAVLDIGIRNFMGGVVCACNESIPFKEIRWFSVKRFKKKIKKKSEFPFLDDEDIIHL